MNESVNEHLEKLAGSYNVYTVTVQNLKLFFPHGQLRMHIETSYLHASDLDETRLKYLIREAKTKTIPDTVGTT